jgi:hypothetical protein
VAREGAELAVGDGAPLAMGLAQVGLDLGERCETIGSREARGDLAQALGRHEGAHVVEHEAAHARAGLRRMHESQQPAHGGADPVDAIRLQASQECRDVVQELREAVRERRRQPVAAPAARHVEADHACIGGEGAGELVEVTPVAAVSMDAQDGAGTVARAPFRIVQPMEARDAQPAERVVPRAGRAGPLRIPARGGGGEQGARSWVSDALPSA